MTSRLVKSATAISLCVLTTSKILSYNPQHLAAVQEYSRRFNEARTDEARKAIVGIFKNFDLSRASLSNINLCGANLAGTNFQNAILTSANFKNCNLQKANFDGADLSSANFNNANLQCASFVRASSYWTTFLNSHKWGSWNVEFEGTKLNNANLANAWLVYCNFKNSRIMNANVQNTNLSYSDLSNSVLDGSNLQTTQLTGASLDNASLVNCGLQQDDIAAKAAKGDNVAFTGLAQEVIHSPGKVKYLVKSGHSNDTYPQEEGKTLLHCAAEQGNFVICQYLLDNGASINTRNARGETPLSLAIHNNHEDITRLLLNINFIHRLLSQGARGFNVNELINGKTLLHIAAQQGCLNTLKLLLMLGADKYTRDNQGRLPICDGENKPAVVDLLKDKAVKNESLRFVDIVGAEDIVAKLQGIIRLFKTRKKEMPSFILFEGPPGTGKTFIARAFANETGFNFIEQAASFNTKYLGESEAAVRNIFEQAISKSPCVVFVDEIDSVAVIDRGGRDSGGGAFKAMQEVLNEFLKGLNSAADRNKENFVNPVMVIGATNFSDALDSAFKDRAEEIIHFTHPSMEGRKLLIEKYLQSVPALFVGENFSSRLAVETKGFSIRQLKKLMDMTIRRAEELDSEVVIEEHFIEPFDHVRKEVYKRTPEQLLRPLFSSPMSRAEAFKSLVGMDDVVKQIDTALAFFREPEKYARVNARIPRGFLLEGPPGTGKTSIAKALAMAGGFTFFNYDGATLLSGGIPLIKQCFEDARSMSPSIIFVDEIDSLGFERSSGSSNSPINKFLSEMQGFNSGDNPVIVVGTTNLVSSLDKALLDRFERIIHIALPGEEARKNILQLYLSKLPLEDNSLLNDPLLTMFAKATENLSGRALEKIVNEIAINAGDNNAHVITKDHIQYAIESLRRKDSPASKNAVEMMYHAKIKQV